MCPQGPPGPPGEAGYDGGRQCCIHKRCLSLKRTLKRMRMTEKDEFKRVREEGNMTR